MKVKRRKKLLMMLMQSILYILTAPQIKNLSNDIIKLTKFSSSKKVNKIRETDILLITYADTLLKKKENHLMY